MSRRLSNLLHHVWVPCGTRAIELEPFEVVMIGLEGVGKSSVLKHLRRLHSIGAVQYSSVGEVDSSPKLSMRRRTSFGNFFHRSHKKRIKTFVSHVGVTVESIESSPWNRLEVSSWTVGRSSSCSEQTEEAPPQPRHYYSGAKAVVFVVDGTDRSGICVARKELQRIVNARELVSAPVVVFANKQDLRECMTLSEIRVRMGLDRMLKGREWRLQGVSTKKEFHDEGIGSAFEWLLSGTPTMPLRYDLPRLFQLFQQGRATLVDFDKVNVSKQKYRICMTKIEKPATQAMALKAQHSNFIHTARLMNFMCNLSPEIAGMILEYLGDTGRVAGNEDKYRKLS